MGHRKLCPSSPLSFVSCNQRWFHVVKAQTRQINRSLLSPSGEMSEKDCKVASSSTLSGALASSASLSTPSSHPCVALCAPPLSST